MTTPPVTVTPVLLSKELYDFALDVLATEEREGGRDKRIDTLRRWLHFRWLVESSTQGEAPSVDVTRNPL